MARALRKRRSVDTWKSKSWYNIIAPPYLGEAKIGETLANDPENLIGRGIVVSMRDITGDFSKQHIKMKFKIVDVKGENAYTAFNGQGLSRDYMRSQIRRKSTRVESITDVTTKDGVKLRIKTIALALGRAQTAQEKLIRRIMNDMVTQFALEYGFQEFIQNVVNGKFSAAIYKAAGKVYPIKRVEIRKTKTFGPVNIKSTPREEAPGPSESS